MKRHIIFQAILLVVSSLIITASVAATTLYVTADSAELKAENTSSSATIAELKRGTELTLISTGGRWYQVTTDTNATGWIYRGKVSEEKPEIEDSADESTGLGGLLGGLSGSDINADAADASRSIRGLSPEAKEYAKTTGTPQQSQDALDSVISRKVTDSDIETFLKEGHVGEYAD